MSTKSAASASTDNSVDYKRTSRGARSVVFLVVCFFSGIVFGFALEKGRVFEPASIRLQMVFERWIMMKMFLGAMGTGMVCFGILSIIPKEAVQRQLMIARIYTEVDMIGRNGFSVVVGCFILGVGMTLSGACPGMVLPQVGAWASQSFFTLIGALFGSLIYGMLHDRLYSKVFPDNTFTLPENIEKITPFKFQWIALPLGCVMVAAVVGADIPTWKSDIAWEQYGLTAGHVQDESKFFLSKIAWPPSICGILIGLLQPVFVLFGGYTLGGSSSLTTISAQLMCTKSLQERFPFLADRRCGVSNWWQVIYAIGGITGGLASALLSGTLGDVPGVPIIYALIGGIFILFGARLAAGCTSGHGLSGAGLLILLSLVGVPFIFMGGISTAFILKWTDQLYRLCSDYCFV